MQNKKFILKLKYGLVGMSMRNMRNEEQLCSLGNMAEVNFRFGIGHTIMDFKDDLRMDFK